MAVVTFDDRPRVPADLPGRDDPDAPDDRPEGHVLRARPGHASSAGEIEEGGTIPVANTAPDVNLDEILEALDGDTQAYLRLLLVGARQGPRGPRPRPRQGARLARADQPATSRSSTARSPQRKDNLAGLIHNFNLLTEDGRRRRATTSPSSSTSSNAALGAIAEQDPNVQRAVALLPGTLEQARDRRSTSVAPFAADARPGVQRPAAVRAQPRRDERLGRRSSRRRDPGDPRTRSGPFVRAARKPVPNLRTAAKRLAKATPRPDRDRRRRSTASATWRPTTPTAPSRRAPPDRDEGYLYWAGWLGHNSATASSSCGDAQRPLPPHLPDRELRRTSPTSARPAQPAGARSCTGFGAAVRARADPATVSRR